MGLSVTPPSRESYVDQFRGLLVAHMALDHCSMMLNAGRWADEFAFKRPENPASLAQFLTRLSGVAVAPGFCFMAGYMVALTALRREARGDAEADIARRLLLRGLVLIAADQSIMGVTRLADGFASMAVLSCLGACLMLIALLRRLSQRTLLLIAFPLLLLHPLLAPGSLFDITRLPAPLPALLYWPDREGRFRSLYPLLPWLGVMLMGYVVGRDSETHGDRRRLWLLAGGASAVGFFVVRGLGGYGNAYSHSGFGSIDFWIFSKYPPDLPWLFASFAIILLALSALRSLPQSVSRCFEPFTVFGRVTFFFYVLHMYVIGIASTVGLSVNLAGTYVAWLVLLALLFWPCAWYFRKKTERPNWLTRYL